jgi:subtilase family serine protease
LSVGGTTLSLSYPPQWSGETVWSDGGGGDSQFEGVPSYQDGLGLNSRGTPDVSYNADPYTGFAVFDSYGSRGWEQFGGTSAGTPQWAALVAIVNQGRELAGKTPLANAQAALYAMPSADFHDIVDGDNQSFSASPGYDLASGLGSPIADRLIPDMVAFNGSTNFTVGAPPIVQQTGKSTHHFSIAVDAVSAGSSGYHTSLLSAHASLLSFKATFASSAFPLSSFGAGTAAVPNETPMRTGHQSRFKSQIRKSDMRAKLAGKHLHDVDAYFAKLGSGVVAG